MPLRRDDRIMLKFLWSPLLASAKPKVNLRIRFNIIWLVTFKWIQHHLIFISKCTLKYFFPFLTEKNNEVVTMTQFLQNIFNWFVGFGAGVGRHFFRKYQFERVAFMAVWFKNYSKLANILKEWQYLAGMTKIQKEWQII